MWAGGIVAPMGMQMVNQMVHGVVPSGKFQVPEYSFILQIYFMPG